MITQLPAFCADAPFSLLLASFDGHLFCAGPGTICGSDNVLVMVGASQ